MENWSVWHFGNNKKGKSLTQLRPDEKAGNNAKYRKDRSTNKSRERRSGYNKAKKSFKKFFNKNHTVKGLEVKTQLEQTQN